MRIIIKDHYVGGLSTDALRGDVAYEVFSIDKDRRKVHIKT